MLIIYIIINIIIIIVILAIASAVGITIIIIPYSLLPATCYLLVIIYYPLRITYHLLFIDIASIIIGHH